MTAVPESVLDGIGHTAVVELHQVVPAGCARVLVKRLALEEALFAGTSTGANVVAALRIASRLGPGATVATLACDTGLKYLSTDLYTPSWLPAGGLVTVPLGGTRGMRAASERFVVLATAMVA